MMVSENRVSEKLWAKEERTWSDSLPFNLRFGDFLIIVSFKIKRCQISFLYILQTTQMSLTVFFTTVTVVFESRTSKITTQLGKLKTICSNMQSNEA